MPYFSDNGFDLVLCQICGCSVNTGVELTFWRTDITMSRSAGNVCPQCLHAHNETGLVGDLLRKHVPHQR